MDRVFIRDLSIMALIGVYDWERTAPQQLFLDIDMEWNCREAAKADSLPNALDYAAVSQRLTTFVQASSYQLIETLAENCAHILLSEFGVNRLILTVRKPGAVPNASTVGVTLERYAAHGWK